MSEIKFKTSWSTLMRLAKAVGDARKYGTEEEIREAEAELESYRKLCLKADEMILDGFAKGDLE